MMLCHPPCFETDRGVTSSRSPCSVPSRSRDAVAPATPCLDPASFWRAPRRRRWTATVRLRRRGGRGRSRARRGGRFRRSAGGRADAATAAMARRMARCVACRMFSVSISSTLASPNPTSQTAISRGTRACAAGGGETSWNRPGRRGPRPSGTRRRRRPGPAHGPRPTSSSPTTKRAPRVRAARSWARSGEQGRRCSCASRDPVSAPAGRQRGGASNALRCGRLGPPGLGAGRYGDRGAASRHCGRSTLICRIGPRPLNVADGSCDNLSSPLPDVGPCRMVGA